jgi:dTMP kinase
MKERIDVTGEHDGGRRASLPLPPPRLVALEGIDGAGKTTVAKALGSLLEGRGFIAPVMRLSPQMGDAMRKLVDYPEDGRRRYQEAIPAEFRRAVYTIEAAIQFRYRAQAGPPPDLYIFDRWLQTYSVYCGPLHQYRSWFALLVDQLPPLDLLVFIRTDPAVAMGRLVSRRDWTATHWHSDALMSELKERYRLYEAMAWPSQTVFVDGNIPQEEVLAELDAILTRHLLSSSVHGHTPDKEGIQPGSS